MTVDIVGKGKNSKDMPLVLITAMLAVISI
jgi:hypothetical protein